jgi:hypoxanthine-DNA glycosylase
MMGKLIGADPALPYEGRIRVLQSAGIALWDVLASCIRVTSLDADIENDSLIPNDFTSFFAAHPNIAWIYFNGAKAEEYYRRYIIPTLKQDALTYKRLPSTSPANASIPYEHKLAAWEAILQHIDSGRTGTHAAATTA